jgi:hypothetical protein
MSFLPYCFPFPFICPFYCPSTHILTVAEESLGSATYLFSWSDSKADILQDRWLILGVGEKHFIKNYYTL